MENDIAVIELDMKNKAVEEIAYEATLRIIEEVGRISRERDSRENAGT